MQDSSAFQFLAIDTIHESTTNPRRTFDEAKLYELAESIKHNGLIQPIAVRPNNQGFEIVAGARRSCSNCIRYRVTTIRFRASRGSEQYQ